MYSKWIKNGFVLAMLLISMVSLSMAACPWFIKNEFYTAQCGVEKVVPASAGLLANDPGATAVLHPEDIKIDAKYGTLEVKANGSFVFDPSPNINSGTYVQFNYIATNGVCQARYPGIAKVLVSCKCRPQVANVNLCLPTTLDAIRQKLKAAGVGCLACGTTPTVIDLSKVKLEPGTYPFSVKCPGCQDAFGSVTLVPGCEASAPSFTFCEGTVALDQLQAMIAAQADCIGTNCDQAPIIDTSGLTVVGEFVTGGSYTATCGAGTECADTATGTITVIPRCEASAPSFTFCEGTVTLDQLQAMIAAQADCIGTNCDQAPIIDTSGLTVVGEFVTGGSYTATCGAGTECADTATGTITVTPRCEASAPDLEFCGPVTLVQVLGGINAGADCIGTGCDQAPIIDTSGLTVVGEFVTGGSYTATCGADTDCADTDTGTITVFQKCTVAAPSIEICEGTTFAGLLEKIAEVADCTGADCDATPVIDTTDVTVVGGLVTGGSYTVTCTVAPNCESSATGTIIVVPRCVLELIGVTVGCATPEEVEENITESNSAPCGDCDIAPVFNFPVWPLRTDGSGFVADGTYQYTVTCSAGLEDCDSTAIGEVIVGPCQPPCPCLADALPIEICPSKVKIPALKAMILDGNATCSGEGGSCDITPAIDTTGVTKDANGFVTGGTYTAKCQTNPDCLPVVATSTVTVVDAPECDPCSCEANAPDICVPYICSRTTCHQYTLDEIKKEISANGGGCSTGCTMTLEFYKDGVETSFSNLKWNEVKHYTYKVICTKGTCVDTDAGKLDVLKLKDCSCTTCHC